MKKTLFLIVCCLICSSAAFADKDPQDFKVVAYRADGTHFEGYITTALRRYFRPKVSEVGISDTFGGEDKKYSSDEVKAIVFPANEKNPTAVVYEAVTAVLRKSMFAKAKPTDTPIFLRLIYDGKHVKGYVMPYVDQTLTTTPDKYVNEMIYTYQYFFMPVDEGLAKPYWMDIKGIMPNAKGAIKKFLKDFPEIGDMIDNGKLTPKEFRDNPAMVLPLMDDFLEKRNNGK